MRVTILASGSSGTCSLIEARGGKVFVDAGISVRTARKRLRALFGAVPSRVDGVVVTHAHGDHARHALAFQRSFETDLHVTDRTAELLALGGRPGVRVFGDDESFRIGELLVTPLPVSHDVPQVSLRFDDGEHAVGFATDLGVVPRRLVPHLSGCSVVLLEANHDAEMLAGGPYPPLLKARIASRLGHLSNGQTAKLLRALDPCARDVVLMHLSEKNNDPDLAVKVVRRALRGKGIRVHVARQREALCVVTRPGGQLGLGLA
jgi:phosphoribosyl 1,2-cyclic phosphodiesterase